MRKTVQRSQGHIRIISGKWKGKKLPILEVQGLRPTGDRLKETLFNWLMFDVQQAQVLDLFAGSGSLGLEALSRGAKQVTFIEQHPQAAQQIRTNLKQLNESNSQVVQQDCLAWLNRVTSEQHLSKQAYNLVFIDPPFERDLLVQCLQALEQAALLAKQAWIYIESEHTLQYAVPSSWQLHREKKTSQALARLYLVQH